MLLPPPPFHAVLGVLLGAGRGGFHVGDAGVSVPLFADDVILMWKIPKRWRSWCHLPAVPLPARSSHALRPRPPAVGPENANRAVLGAFGGTAQPVSRLTLYDSACMPGVAADLRPGHPGEPTSDLSSWLTV